MESLDPQLRRLIDEAMPSAEPTAGAVERGAAALLAQIESTPGPAAPSPPLGVGAGKLVLVVATVVAVGAGGWLATRPEPPRTRVAAVPAVPAGPRPRSATPAPSAASAKVPTATAPTPAPTLAVPTARPTGSATSRPSRNMPPTDTLRAEAELVAQAESALDRGQAEEAAALCEQHRTAFSKPQLRAECEAITASAACALDRENTKKARAFLRAAPRSALSTKVRRRCKLDSPPIQKPSRAKTER